MCGIAGMVDWRAATPADALRSIADAMIETVRRRGPDAGEVWVEAEGGVALGQRRLAIIDLSPGGAQPMHSAERTRCSASTGRCDGQARAQRPQSMQALAVRVTLNGESSETRPSSAP